MSIFHIIVLAFGCVMAAGWLALGPCSSATYSENCWDKTPNRWWVLGLFR